MIFFCYCICKMSDHLWLLIDFSVQSPNSVIWNQRSSFYPIFIIRCHFRHITVGPNTLLWDEYNSSFIQFVLEEFFQVLVSEKNYYSVGHSEVHSWYYHIMLQKKYQNNRGSKPVLRKFNRKFFVVLFLPQKY